eukprot:284816070_6
MLQLVSPNRCVRSIGLEFSVCPLFQVPVMPLGRLPRSELLCYLTSATPRDYLCPPRFRTSPDANCRRANALRDDNFFAAVAPRSYTISCNAEAVCQKRYIDIYNSNKKTFLANHQRARLNKRLTVEPPVVSARAWTSNFQFRRWFWHTEGCFRVRHPSYRRVIHTHGFVSKHYAWIYRAPGSSTAQRRSSCGPSSHSCGGGRPGGGCKKRSADGKTCCGTGRRRRSRKKRTRRGPRMRCGRNFPLWHRYSHSLAKGFLSV